METKEQKLKRIRTVLYYIVMNLSVDETKKLAKALNEVYNGEMSSTKMPKRDGSDLSKQKRVLRMLA